MEGYFISDGRYERVASVKYRPKISCHIQYEWKEASRQKDNLHYMVYLLKKGVEECGYGYPELYGMKEKELQIEINQEIKRELGEEIRRSLREEESFEPQYVGCRCNVFLATQDKLLLRYMLLYDSIKMVEMNVWNGIQMENSLFL